MWNLKGNGTKEVTYETERDSQRSTPWLLQKVVHTLLYLKRVLGNPQCLPISMV